ncbi:unnamed protein product [Caenorhabditis bovis]|uniref:Nudix hydrolase domain-containing protein n=1 Tax=Caenorhabditis bovis TaxID=2654633 RepID=A0A8S1FBB8_9PELO|nr:unnamed protein product [Caenorhabditis bovis]
MSVWNHLVCKSIMAFIHKKCRVVDTPYLRSSIHRFFVPDDKVKWSVNFAEYDPPEYTDPIVLGKPWADPDIGTFSPKWNNIDGKINRVSFVCDYSFDYKMRPINPMGRTGISGRGILGKWGPNHAADPLVTRYNDHGDLEFVAIQRGDTGEWAIPGGMVDAGEQVSEAIKREFTEEAMNGVIDSEKIDELWKQGKELYKGYVDDPRNTDNAWMETVVINFHDVNDVLKNVELKAGDDAKDLRWIRVDSNEPLYASHSHFIEILKSLRALKLR